MSSITLMTSVNAVFGADGMARASVGPRVFGVTWTVERYGTNTNSATDTKLFVYRNNESDANYLDSSDNANNDVSDNNAIPLQTLDTLLFVWSGGSVGAIATASIFGTQDGVP